MGKAPAFQFYVRDWLSDPQLRMVSHQSKGIWIDLLCYLWESPDRGKLEGTDQQFIKMIGCSKEEWEQFYQDANVTKFADVTNSNGYVTVCNRRMFREEKDRRDTRLRVQKHREKKSSNGSSNDSVTPPSSSSSSSSPLKKERNSKRKSLIPEDYKLTQEHIDYAVSKGVTENIRGIFEGFCIYHRKQGSKFVNWFAAWQTWIRKKLEFDKQNYIAKAQEPDLKAQQERDEYLEQFTVEELRANRERIKNIGEKAVKKG